MEGEKFDAIIVGAGPAGVPAALTLARAGLDAVIIERGEYPGAKNMTGGILFSTILNKLIPNFWEEAPVERNVTRRRFALLSEDSELAVDIRSDSFNSPPYNNSFTVLRAKFDRWFAGKAEEAGALLITDTVVDDLIWREGKVVGVRTRREEGDLYADVVVCAEGANSLLAEKSGLKPRPSPDHMGIGVKEVIALPSEVIEDRFSLVGGEGAGFEYLGGAAVMGMFGGGFIYTNKDSVSLGITCSIRDMSAREHKPNDILEHFKSHPAIRPLIRGGETVEYSAHMIPEGGYRALPRLFADGLLLVGDSAGLVNASIYHEGSNLAMASGVFAAETIIEAKKRGDFSANTLSLYEKKLRDSFVMKDLKKFRRMSEFCLRNPQVFEKYPDLLNRIAGDYFTITERPKSDVEKGIIGRIRREVGFLRLARDILKAGGSMR
ncbi:MAG: FAD-dependent oxidoreductase [bacterium]